MHLVFETLLHAHSLNGVIGFAGWLWDGKISHDRLDVVCLPSYTHEIIQSFRAHCGELVNLAPGEGFELKVQAPYIWGF